jgi:hypothetical protein
VGGQAAGVAHLPAPPGAHLALAHRGTQPSLGAAEQRTLQPLNVLGHVAADQGLVSVQVSVLKRAAGPGVSEAGGAAPGGERATHHPHQGLQRFDETLQYETVALRPVFWDALLGLRPQNVQAQPGVPGVDHRDEGVFHGGLQAGLVPKCPLSSLHRTRIFSNLIEMQAPRGLPLQPRSDRSAPHLDV